MADPVVTVSTLLAPAFAAVGGEGADPVVRPSDRADAQANGALAIAKQVGKNPRQVAEEVLAIAREQLADVCSTIEIAGPGFLNLTFSDSFLAQQLAEAAADPRLGVRTATLAEHIIVDYSHPNVAKEMHVGHLRTTVIGDSLVRMLQLVGHRVTKENHIGDWGTPFGMLIEHMLDLGETTAANDLSVGDLAGFYKGARAKFDADEVFQDRARQRVVLLQGGDAETLRLWGILVAESTRYFNGVYATLGVLLTDEDLAPESMYNPMLPVVVDRLRESGLLLESDGAQVVFPPGYLNREGEPLPLIVQNSVGGYNYATTDLACVIDRVERLHADRMVYVVGAPQAQHLAMVFAVAEMAGWLQPGVAVHVSFGNVLGADRKMLKSRSGESLKLSELLDEAIERAEQAVAEKNPDLPAAERSVVAHAIGMGAVKYADLSTDRIKDYVFEWDRMLSFDGNTAPYLQYAHARICSIFRRAGVSRETVRSTTPVLGTLQERSLALRLLAFDTAVWDTIDRYSPHRLCTYLFDLAQDFTAFYEHCPVLKAADEATMQSRLALCDVTARVMGKGLDLLGIVAPERM
ncbi:MAG: arginine--tRNA ligase [Actinobacteria bacterium]|nr:arginine--tRNA ligase [Actinomycetota bacterium]